MADIIPFKGMRYNTEKIKDISKVVAPPYDVISESEQDELYNLSPHNIIRILLGKDFPKDNEKENKYTRAYGFLKEWSKKGILTKDAKTAIYIYEQEFKIGNGLKRRLGFIALLKLEDFDKKASSIYPHENTLTAPKEDRAKLIRTIESNLGPIFSIFEDKNKIVTKILQEQIKKMPPTIDIYDSHNIRNKLWCLFDRKVISDIVGKMKKKKIFIADGHHRYEVALEFSKFKNDPKYGYILAYFTDLYSDGLVILPVHRLVGGVSEDILAGLIADLEKHFVIKGLASKKQTKDFLNKVKPSESRFVFYEGKTFRGLIFKGRKSLDVTTVQNMIIKPVQEKVLLKGRKFFIDFTKDLDYAIRKVDEERFSFAVLLNPVPVTQIRDVAFVGTRMPQKSTYFYPKVLTGLVINVF